MAKKNGTTFVVDKDSTAVSHLQDTTLNISQELIDATTKDSGGWTERLPGLRDWSIDLTQAYDPSGSNENVYEFIKSIEDRNSISVVFRTTDAAGALKVEGTMYVDGDVSLDAPLEDLVTGGLTLVGSGAPTITEVGS